MVTSAPLSLEMQLLKETTPPPHTLRLQVKTFTTPQAALLRRRVRAGFTFENCDHPCLHREQLTPPPWSACQALPAKPRQDGGPPVQHWVQPCRGVHGDKMQPYSRLQSGKINQRQVWKSLEWACSMNAWCSREQGQHHSIFSWHWPSALTVVSNVTASEQY